MNPRVITISVLAFLMLTALVAAVAGCGGRGGRASGRQTVTVPPGGRLVSYGQFPMPPFSVPTGGTVYVYEDETDRVMMVFGVTAEMEPIDFTTMPNEIAKHFKPKLHYKVYFVEGEAPPALTPAAMPAAPVPPAPLPAAPAPPAPPPLAPKSPAPAPAPNATPRIPAPAPPTPTP